VRDLLVLTALRVEEHALRLPAGTRVLRSGMGPERARIAAARGLAVDARGVAIAGLCAAVSPALRAGDVVLASELRRDGADPVAVPGSAMRPRSAAAACACRSARCTHSTTSPARRSAPRCRTRAS